MSLTHSLKIVTNGLVLCLDAGSKKSYAGTGNVWRDLSGNGNDGTLTNGPTFSSANGGSIILDGTNDHISISNGNYLNTNDFSISCWIYLNPILSIFTMYNFFDKNIYNTSGIQFGIGTGGALSNRILGIRYSTSGVIANTYQFAPSNLDIPFESWINISLVFSYINLNSFISLYINGIFNAISSSSNGTFVPNTKNLTLGAPGTGLGSYFNGKISNYLIYNKALSAQEIKQNFNATKSRFGLL
jgi:hypothetical protein